MGNKGYISPFDIISGFTELGYNMFFSVVFGVSVGVVLSFFIQSGWAMDPLFRTNVRKLIRAQKQTQNNTGVFDDDGVFNSEKFELLFSKYAKSENILTVPEFFMMTKEQERLGNDIKSWTKIFAELCTLYFFVGHRGYLTKDDVCSAYDGTLFYRLRDSHKLNIRDKKRKEYPAELNGLKGSYLSKSYYGLRPKDIEHKLHVLFSQWQSDSSIMNALHLRDWISYFEDTANSVKDFAIPRSLRRSMSMIHGVPSPKEFIHTSSNDSQEDPTSLFPDGLTGVAKSVPTIITADVSLADNDLFSALLSPDQDSTASLSLNGSILFGEHATSMNHQDPIIFKYLSNDNDSMLHDARAGMVTFNSTASDYPLSPSEPTSADSNVPMDIFLQRDDADYENWHVNSLTGVQYDTTQSTGSENTKKTSDIPSDKPSELANELNDKVDLKRETEELVIDKPNADEIGEAATAITPPPDEKIAFTFDSKVNTPEVTTVGTKPSSVTHNKVKGKNRKK
ncbi:MAG: Caleosin related protein-domain-containing protein [Benjaminiella poitrasii]|nr:MAG: Caleosin related protein-domain-containing protein [Benjaminiella poitrasii]